MLKNEGKTWERCGKEVGKRWERGGKEGKSVILISVHITVEIRLEKGILVMEIG